MVLDAYSLELCIQLAPLNADKQAAVILYLLSEHRVDQEIEAGLKNHTITTSQDMQAVLKIKNLPGDTVISLKSVFDKFNRDFALLVSILEKHQLFDSATFNDVMQLEELDSRNLQLLAHSWSRIPVSLENIKRVYQSEIFKWYRNHHEFLIGLLEHGIEITHLKCLDELEWRRHSFYKIAQQAFQDEKCLPFNFTLTSLLQQYIGFDDLALNLIRRGLFTPIHQSQLLTLFDGSKLQALMNILIEISAHPSFDENVLNYVHTHLHKRSLEHVLQEISSALSIFAASPDAIDWQNIIVALSINPRVREELVSLKHAAYKLDSDSILTLISNAAIIPHLKAAVLRLPSVNNHVDEVNSIIKHYYLRPFPKKAYGPYLVLRDASAVRQSRLIERPLHGVIHAANVSVYVRLLHNFMKSQLPEQISAIEVELEQVLGLNFQTILELTTIAAAFHDSARRNDKHDDNETGNAKYCYDYLVASGRDSKHARYFSNFILLKDKSSVTFKESSEKIGYTATENHIIYPKTLLYIADSLDIIRCNGRFSISFTVSQLKQVFTDDIVAGLEPSLIALSHGIAELITHQGNLLFDTNVNDTTYPANYQERQKVGIEYSDQPFDVVHNMAQAIPALTQYLTEGIVDETAKPAEITPGYNPLLHGTTSAIFSVFARNQYRISSIIEMVYEQHTAPMTGELNNGGYQALITKTHGTVMGATSFTRLHTIYPSRYNLQAIINEFANGYRLSERERFVTIFQNKVNDSILNSFARDIHLITICFVQCKQYGMRTADFFPVDMQVQFFNKLNSHIVALAWFEQLNTTWSPNQAYIYALSEAERKQFRNSSL